MSLLDEITGGATNQATEDQKNALAQLQAVQTPTTQQLDLPALQQYASAVGMSPAQMQAFLQQNNALNGPVDQTGTSAQEAAIGQLANVSNAGAAGTPQEQAQIAQALQQSNQNLQGQRGSIDQQAEARGVSPGMLQAALGQVQSGQDQQSANQAALQAQSQEYQAALGAMTSGANAGQALQGQQNTQANTVAQAQNAMQQFNAANQQQAAGTNAANTQAANMLNTNNANTVAQANTGLKNQQTLYNAAVPETVFNNQMQKATGVAGQGNQMAGTATQQGQQAAGLTGGLLGAAGTVAGAYAGAPAKTPAPQQQSGVQAAPLQNQGYADGGITMKSGGMIPGHAKVSGDSKANDTVPIRVSPGEAVVPRSVVKQNPIDVMRLLAGRPASTPRPGEPMPPLSAGMPQQPQAPHNPQDIAALLQAMKHLRGAH